MNTKTQDPKGTLLKYLGSNQDVINQVSERLWNNKVADIVGNFISTVKEEINDANQTIERNENSVQALQELLDSVGWNSVKERYNNLKKTINADAEKQREFNQHIYNLFKQLNIDGITGASVTPDFKSADVGTFQLAVFNKKGENEQYAAAWNKLKNNMVTDDMSEEAQKNKVCDNILWANTLASLIDFARAWLDFSKKEVEQQWNVTLEADERVQLNDWADKIPDNIADLEKCGAFNEKGFFVCKPNVINVDREYPKDQFVMIWWERFYLWEITDGNPVKKDGVKMIKQIPEVYQWTDENWRTINLIKNHICFGSLEWGEFVKKTEIVVNQEGKQLKSTTTWPRVWWEDWEQLMFTIVWWEKKTENEWESNETTRFDAKWRLEFWDTRRMNDEQLNALFEKGNSKALKYVLDQSITAYKNLMHKPSIVWRYNLSNVMLQILKRYDSKRYDRIVDEELKGISDRKRVIQKFLWLKHWLFSNPENEIKWNTELKYGDVDGVNVDYIEEKTQCDRICNALTYLKALVEKNSKDEPDE